MRSLKGGVAVFPSRHVLTFPQTRGTCFTSGNTLLIAFDAIVPPNKFTVIWHRLNHCALLGENIQKLRLRIPVSNVFSSSFRYLYMMKRI